MTQLARRHDGRSLTRLEELAQREEVSGNFLVQILNDLKRAGLIESRRGKTGGYLLAKEPSSISLRQIVAAVDPALLECPVTAQGESGQAVRQSWEAVSKELSEALGRIPLSRLADQAGAGMFYI